VRDELAGTLRAFPPAAEVEAAPAGAPPARAGER
jgi:hypothetical protein